MTTPPSHPALVAKRARLRRLRARVAAGAVATFLALFSGLYVQMATGHDPALGAESAQVATSSTDTSASSTTTTEQEDTAPMTTAAS